MHVEVLPPDKLSLAKQGEYRSNGFLAARISSLPLATTESTPHASSSAIRLHAVRELNGLRGLAALIVFFAHCLGYIGPDLRWAPAINLLNAVARSFNSWVDVFFVLSGYLITSILLRRRGSPHYFRNFYWRRALRILPLYTAALVAILLLFPHSGRYVLLSMFFLANFNGFFHIYIDGPFWTLAIEEQFYLLWPTVIVHRSVSQLRRLSLLIAISVILLRFAACLTTHNNFNLTFFRLDGLAMGAWLACYFFTRQPTTDVRRRENLWFSVTLAVGALLAITAGVLSTAVRPQYYPRALAITGMVVAYTGFFGLLLAHQGKRGPQALLRTRVLGFFGLISYAFYMTHMYVILLYDRWRTALIPGDVRGYLIRLVVTFAATTALSLLSRYIIELPALSLRRRLLPPSVPPAETQLPLSQA